MDNILQSSTTKEPVEEDVDTVEITYIDPNTGSVCSREAYCDPEDWRNRYQARLLVSSDLVNSLSEAVAIWQSRFKQIHHTLTDNRMGYYYELHSIRQYLTRLFEYIWQQEAKQLAASEEADDAVVEAMVGMSAAEEEEPKVVEVCPVHFFYPDMYLDAWTKDRLKIATESCKQMLNSEIKSINERINLMGGGTWRQLLSYFMRHGHDPLEMVKALWATVEDPEERKEIVNTMTNGLQELFDALQVKVDELKEENSDMTRRFFEVNQLEGRQRIAIEEILEKLKKMKKYLDAPGFVEPEPEDDSAEVKEAQQQLFAQKEGSIKAWTDKVRKLKKQLQEARDRLAEFCDPNVLTQLQEEIRDLKRKTKVVDMRTEGLNEQIRESDAKTAEIEEKIDIERKKIEELRAKLGTLPPPNPQGLKMKRMQREIQELARQDKKIKKAIEGPTNRIKAMRVQLRVLYKKLGWEWDLSDSDGDEDLEKMPYWKRRKMAEDGFLPFDARTFLLQEQEFKKKRRQKREIKGKKEQKSDWEAQMKARRQNVHGQMELPEQEEEEEKEVGPKLFRAAPQTQQSEDDSPRTAKTNWHNGVAAASALTRMSKMLSKGDKEFAKRSAIDSTMSKRDIDSMMSKRGLVVSRGKKDLDDPVVRAISSARENLSSSREVPLRIPSWLQNQHDDEERESRQRELDRLLQLRESFESQLRQCVECFIDILPDSGALRDLRNRLVDTLARLHEPPKKAFAWQEQDDLERDLRTISEAFQYAIDHGENVRPISAAMVHSVRFRDLRHMLEEVLESERAMREALEDIQGSRQQNIASDSSENSPEPTRRRKKTLADSLCGNSPNDSRTFSSVSQLRGTSTSEELSDSLRVPPRFQTSNSFFGGQKSKKNVQKKVDFGFRPDGAGEDSLENWSLFKVSKGFGSTSMSGFGDTVSTSIGLSSSSTSDKMLRTDTKMRRHRASFECDFHEYMSQASEREGSNWQTASAPSLHTSQKKKKSLPHLPKLVKSSTGLSAASCKSLDGVKADGVGSWTHCPPRISVPSKKFAATTPSNSFFT